MNNIHDYLSQVVLQTQAYFADDNRTDLKKCEIHGGNYDPDALEHDSPAVIFANAGVGELHHLPSGEQDIKLQMVAYLLVYDPQVLQREQTMMQLQVELLSFLDWQRWGLCFTHPVSAIEALDAHGLMKDFKSDTSSWRTGVSVLARAADLYAESTQNQLSLWIVSWEQHLRLGTEHDSVLTGIQYDATPTQVNSRLFSAIDMAIPPE